MLFCQWSNEGTNRIPITVFKPCSIVGRLLVGYVIVSFTSGSITVDSIRFIGYQLGIGSQKYTITLDYDTYSLHGLSIAGNTIGNTYIELRAIAKNLYRRMIWYNIIIFILHMFFNSKYTM